MREQYPFFREEDERTRAVIGAEAVDSDLNGTYQKPYAILSNKRLYCKNEQGNFIADGKSVRLEGREKAQRSWMVLVSALLLFSTLLTTFANGTALGLLTFRTQKNIGEAEKIVTLQQEVNSLWEQMDVMEEDRAGLTANLNTYGAEGLKQIYDECGLAELPAERSSALAMLRNAEGFLSASLVGQTTEVTDEQQVAMLAMLAQKFRLGVSESGLYWFFEVWHAGYAGYEVTITPESMELFTQLCDMAREFDSLWDYRLDIEESLYYSQWVDIGSEEEKALARTLAQKGELWKQCNNALLGYADYYNWNLSSLFNECGYELQIGSLVDLLVWLYLDCSLDGATPSDFLNMLALYEKTGVRPWDAASEVGIESGGEEEAFHQLSDETLKAITEYDAEEREQLLLPLAQLGRENIATLAAYVERSEQLTRLRSSVSGEATQIARSVATPEGISILQRIVRRASFCAWIALAGGVALLVFFALNLGKLSGLVGAAAGMLYFLYSIPGAAYPEASMLVRIMNWLPAVIGLAVVALCALTFLQITKKEVVPTFRLVTSAGTFTFREKDYSKKERETFAAALTPGKEGA